MVDRRTQTQCGVGDFCEVTLTISWPRKIVKLRQVARERGAAAAARKVLRHLRWLAGIIPGLERQRRTLSRRVHRQTGGIVRHGPFAEMKLLSSSTWGPGDRAAMLLGLYEREVLDTIVSEVARRPVFIDIGAADGFYAVGLLRAGLIEKAICFEMRAAGREMIARLAQDNGIAPHRIEILGEADGPAIERVVREASAVKCVILCDIEGAEVDILSEHVLRALEGAVIVVEVHKQGELRPEEVERRVAASAVSAGFTVDVLRQGPRNPVYLPELADFEEAEKWLICSEARGYPQHWLVLRPGQ